jgi:hypothetical protein
MRLDSDVADVLPACCRQEEWRHNAMEMACCRCAAGRNTVCSGVQWVGMVGVGCCLLLRGGIGALHAQARRSLQRRAEARPLHTSLVLQGVGTFDPHRRAVLVLQQSWHSRNSTRLRTRASSGQRLGGTTQRTFWSGWQR